MKLKITYLFVLFTFLFVNVTKSQEQNPHPFELGLNIGASWYKSDVKMKKLGLGAGLTFGQTYCLNNRSALFWGWRFRYLNATAYGQDFQKSYGIKNNFVLNGTNDTALNYFNNGGYVYQNYKSTLDELSFEMKIGSNRLRQRTNILAYVFGGAGLTKAVTKIDQLDGLNRRYNYNLIDSAGTASKSDILSSLNNMYDGNYETNAEGSKNPRWMFMPSFGVGLGYQVTPGFSLGFEHKMTWSLHDLLEGQQWTNTNEKTGTNDIYHYTSFWLKFSFGGSGRGNSTTNTTTNTNTLVNTIEKPIVTFTNPAVNPYNTTQQAISLTAKVTDVNSKADISLVINGNSIAAFSYNPSSDVLSYVTNLNSGSNTIEITATNTVGSTTASEIINYSEPISVPLPPAITIVSPNSNPSSTNTNTSNVVASITNVTASNQISVLVNGVANNSFSFNSSTRQLSLNTNLVLGSNTVVISASNAAGNDTKSIAIIYNQPVVNTTPAPIVTIVNPNSNPYATTASSQSISAVIQNITAKSQINANINGSPIMTSAITYNATTGQASFNVNLFAGANSITVGATNVSGADSKSVTIIYSQPVVNNTTPAPVVTIVNPNSNPYTTTASSQSIVAVIQNITSKSQINASLNGGPIMTSAITFNTATGQASFSVNLISGANVITVGATNVSGADSKSTTVIYSQPAPTVLPPTIAITNPTTNPYTTNSSSTNVSATVMNIASSSEIAVLFNGVATNSFSFNAGTHQLTFGANLVLGANTVVINATNAAGTASKSVTIIYNEPVVNTTPAPVVTIVTPATSPYNTTVSSQSIVAVIQNITSKSQINASLNGGPIMTSAITFNTATGKASFNVNLISGANVITVGATNVSGADSKSTTVIYSQPAPTVLPPTIAITNPTTNPYTTNSNSTNVSATVMNIASSSELSVLFNGVATNSFSFNAGTHQLTFGANLVLGANTVVINATNSSGTASKSVTIMYSMPAPVVLPPVVAITNPSANPFNTIAPTQAISASVTNVSSSSQINVAINGVSTSTFTYNSSTSQLSLTATLVMGTNTVSITANNSAGTDTKSTTIIRTMPAPVVLPPTVSFLTPASSPLTVNSATYVVTAKTTNVASASQISVKVNGVSTTAFTFVALTKKITLTTTLNVGTNTVVISVTNSAGTDSKTTTIVYEQIITTTPDTLHDMPNVDNPDGTGVTPISTSPIISVLSPTSNPFSTTDATIIVSARITNIDGASNILIKQNGNTLSGINYLPKTKTMSIPISLVSGANVITIKATNGSGTKTETITINR